MLKQFRLLAAGAALAFAGGAVAQTVGFATLPPGSILHAQASVIAKVVQDNSRLQVRVIGYGGDAPAMDAVNTQKADFLLLDVGEIADGAPGGEELEGRAQAEPAHRHHDVRLPDGVLRAQGLKHPQPRRPQGQARGRRVGAADGDRRTTRAASSPPAG